MNFNRDFVFKNSILYPKTGVDIRLVDVRHTVMRLVSSKCVGQSPSRSISRYVTIDTGTHVRLDTATRNCRRAAACPLLSLLTVSPIPEVTIECGEMMVGGRRLVTVWCRPSLPSDLPL